MVSLDRQRRTTIVVMETNGGGWLRRAHCSRRPDQRRVYRRGANGQPGRSRCLIREIREAALEIRPDMILLCHGGPIAMPEDVREILKLVPVQGFVGASSIERLPVENGIRHAVAAFAAIPLRT